MKDTNYKSSNFKNGTEDRVYEFNISRLFSFQNLFIIYTIRFNCVNGLKINLT